MKTTTVYTSTWMHLPTKKLCKIYGAKDSDSISRATKFNITGHNPLPCFTFTGTYGVLVKWLEDNGWVRVHNMNVYSPDTVTIYKI